MTGGWGVPATPLVIPATPLVVPATPLVVPAMPLVIPAAPLVVPAVPLVILAVPLVVPATPLVVPAKAGTHGCPAWIPACGETEPAGMTGGAWAESRIRGYEASRAPSAE